MKTTNDNNKNYQTMTNFSKRENLLTTGKKVKEDRDGSVDIKKKISASISGLQTVYAEAALLKE